MTETWRTVPGYEGAYEVSDLGRIRSIRRTVTQRVTNVRQDIPERILRANPNAKGYLCVALHLRGTQRTHTVSAVVAAAFLGPRPFGHYVCHSNGNKTDNRVANLRYDTPASNTADSFKHGVMLFGETMPQSKLTLAQVMAIRGDDRPNSEIAAEYGCTPSNVGHIKRGKSWRRAIALAREAAVPMTLSVRSERGIQKMRAAIKEAGQ